MKIIITPLKSTGYALIGQAEGALGGLQGNIEGFGPGPELMPVMFVHLI